MLAGMQFLGARLSAALMVYTAEWETKLNPEAATGMTRERGSGS